MVGSGNGAAARERKGQSRRLAAGDLARSGRFRCDGAVLRAALPKAAARAHRGVRAGRLPGWLCARRGDEPERV